MATMGSAAGYQNLPSGNWAPAIYSQKVLKYFRRASVAEAITKLTDTKWVSITTGTYDVFAWVILPTAEALGKFLRNRIGEIQGVKKTETFVSLQVVKRELE